MFVIGLIRYYSRQPVLFSPSIICPPHCINGDIITRLQAAIMKYLAKGNQSVDQTAVLG